MFKKFHKEFNTLTDSESENIDENILKGAENLLINVIGAINVKRWSALKIVYSCKTDEEFVTKLLDIAQQHINRKFIGDENTNLVSVKSSKELKKNTKNKVISIHKQYTGEKNRKRNKYAESSNVRIKNKTILRKSNNIQKTKTENKIILMPDKKMPEEDLKNQTAELNQLDVKKDSSPDDADKCKVSDSQPAILKLESESSNIISNNLDVIRIKLCHFCNTHHIQDHCPINLPQSIINDILDYDSWIQKYKPIYENSRQKVKSENKNGNVFVDILKYSYAIMSLPEFLYIGETNSSHGLGVFVKKKIEPFTQFGPLIGNDVKEMDIPEDIDMKYLWEVNVEKRNIYINTENADTSNWIRFIRPAPNREDKNISVISKQDKLYFITVKQITVGDELLYWQDCPNTMNKKKMEKTTCGGCNMVFSHPQYYRVHCSVFHDVRYSLTIKKYHCKICGEAVLGKENIVKHAAELHNGQGAYQCQFCKKFFLRLNYLEMHRTYGCSANPHRSRPLCDFCGRKFCQPQKLKVHIKRMHSDFSEVLKEFQCKSCLKILGSRAALQRHAKEVHQKQTEGQCSCIRCGKRFQNKSNLKIHMLTHSGIKPFRCTVTACNAAFTTKQCLQFHYKKVHNFTEENMPKIERSIDYTFQAYSGGENVNKNNTESLDTSKSDSIANQDDRNSDTDNDSLDSQSIDDPLPMQQSPPPITDLQTTPPSPQEDYHKTSTLGTNIKVLSKGSKKWIADEQSQSKIPDIYSIERLSKDDLQISLQETDIYDRTNFTRHEASNASLLVEAALDSVCNEPNIDIDVNTSQNCTDTLVNNLYTLTQPDNLPDVSYGEAACINDSRDINLISPSVNDHISVTDELNDELSHNDNIGMHYSNFAHNNFSPPHTPDVHRSNFVRNYINSLSPQNTNYSQKNTSPVPSPPRYDFGHNVNTDHLSSDDSNGMVVQNLSLNNSKNDIQLDLSIYKSPYKSANNDYIRKFNFENKNPLDHEHIDVISQGDVAGNNQMESEIKESADTQNQPKFPDELSSDIRNKFDIDLDIRLKNYDNIDSDSLRLRNHTYENNELDFRNKAYDLLDAVENRNKQYDLDSDFRTDRNFEPLMLNSSELQGLDMSARSFHSYTNINRFHHLYPDMDRVDIRLNYSPPPPTYTHADILRVVSLDLTPPGRHSVDLSLRNHSLHQIANSRLLTDHGLQTNHRLLDQTRLLTADLTSTRHLSTDRIISEASTRILTDHTTSRILNEPISTNHLLNTDQNRLLAEESRLLDQGRLIGDGRILPTVTPSGAISPVQTFGGYSVAQNPYHPTPIAPRPHVTSPTPTPYHYPTYY